MIQFELKEYLKNPNRQVVTRDGRKVTRFLCTDAQTEFPIIALVEAAPCSTKECLRTFTKNGRYFTEENSPCDLFFLPNKKEGWVNLYTGYLSNVYVVSKIFSTEEDAKKEKPVNYVATIKIEWEE